MGKAQISTEKYRMQHHNRYCTQLIVDLKFKFRRLFFKTAIIKMFSICQRVLKSIDHFSGLTYHVYCSGMSCLLFGDVLCVFTVVIQSLVH